MVLSLLSETAEWWPRVAQLGHPDSLSTLYYYLLAAGRGIGLGCSGRFCPFISQTPTFSKQELSVLMFPLFSSRASPARMTTDHL